MYKVSSAQMPVTQHADLASWTAEITAWVEEAAANGSKLLLFPEFASLSLAGLLTEDERANADGMLLALQRYLPDFHRVHEALAAEHNVVIVAASFAVLEGSDLYNRAFVYGPKGQMGYQDKLILTKFEREKTSIKAGAALKTFEAEFGRFAVAICFDSQFPLIVRKAVDADAKLILVPACTGAMTGFNRVRIGCQARALENQIPVIQSSTVGDAKWQSIADTNCGAAGLYGPPDNGFPTDGIIKMGEPNVPCWVHMEVDFEAFANIRQNGHVRNWSCWDEQFDVNDKAEAA